MTVATFVQPVFTSQDAATYKAAIDASVNVVGKTAGAFAPHEAATPAMTIVVDAGSVQFGITPVAKTAQTSGTITAPSVNPRIDRAVIDSITGVLSIITGAEAASPVAPALTAGKIAIAQIALATSTTTITNSLITDERNSSYIGIIDEDTMASDSAVLAPSQQSVKAYVDGRIVILDTPESLTTSVTEATWLTISSTTLANAGARAAFLRGRAIATHTGTALSTSIAARKTGSALGVGALTDFAKDVVNSAASSTLNSYASGQTLVNLDSSEDFDYRVDISSGTLSSFDLVLVGYIL